MAAGARGTLWPRSLSRETSWLPPLSRTHDSPLPPGRGHPRWVLALLNQTSPCPCECPCWRGLIRRAEHVTPGPCPDRVLRPDSPWWRRRHTGSHPKLPPEVPPWPSLESPDAAPASSEWAAHRQYPDPPREAPHASALANGGTPLLAAVVITASPSVHPQLSPGHQKLGSQE